MKRSQKFYRKNEADVMESLGFRPTKDSGSGWIEKEDGISDHCICQLKSTDKKSISIKHQDIETLKNNAVISDKIPIFAIQFLETGETWLMIRPEDILDVKDIICGEKEKNTEDLHLCIDIEQDTCYNDSVDESYRENCMARERYRRRREENDGSKKGDTRKRSIKNWKIR